MRATAAPERTGTARDALTRSAASLRMGRGARSCGGTGFANPATLSPRRRFPFGVVPLAEALLVAALRGDEEPGVETAGGRPLGQGALDGE